MTGLSAGGTPLRGDDPPRPAGVADRGGMVVGWLVKVSLVVMICGVIAFDGLSVLVAEISVQDNADRAVMAASEAYQGVPDVQVAYDAAVGSLGSTDAVIPPRSFKVRPDGTVRLRVDRTAATLVLRYFEPAKSLVVVRATSTGRSEIV